MGVYSFERHKWFDFRQELFIGSGKNKSFVGNLLQTYMHP